ncbi:MAG: hypothetical protein GY782_06795 [Gammaproteobacteria bacterium]|nr:hypothetical protein [Gammaproteobacteria bacterium]
MNNNKEYFGRNTTTEEMLDSILAEIQRREGNEESLLVVSTVLNSDDWSDEEIENRYNEIF